MTALIDDTRGSAYVETLIALPVLLVVFASLYTFVHLAAAHVIVQRAASAAARAAVVFLPDDPVYYATCSSADGCKDYVQPGKQAAKQACVKQAAMKVLASARFFKLSDRALVKVDWNSAQVWEQVTVKVTAQYDCSWFIGGFICGTDRVAELTAASTLNYQQGPVRTQAGL